MSSCPSLLLNKDRGDKFVIPERTKLSPQDAAKAKKLAGCENFENLFARAPLLAAVDCRLGDGAFRILAVLSFASWRTGFAPIGFDELASVLGCSARSVIRGIGQLEESGYIKAARSHNKRNVYSLIARPATVKAGASDPAEPKRAEKPLLKCGKCHKPCGGLMKTGWCRSCTTEVKFRRIAREEAREELRATA